MNISYAFEKHTVVCPTKLRLDSGKLRQGLFTTYTQKGTTAMKSAHLPKYKMYTAWDKMQHNL